jgi:hypothetical protein
LSLGRISKDEFFKKFPETLENGFLRAQLDQALQDRDPNAVEHLMLLGFHLGFAADCAEVLCKLLLQDWHMQHENIAMVLQDLRHPATVDCLYQTALAELAYLEYDESYALGVKCIFALQAIGTDRAKEKLALIAGGSNPVLAEKARQLLLSLDNVHSQGGKR